MVIVVTDRDVESHAVRVSAKEDWGPYIYVIEPRASDGDDGDSYLFVIL